MGRARNISRDLPGKNGSGGVRSARVPKEVAENKRKGHRVGSQATKPVAVLDEELNVVEQYDSVWDSLGFSPEESASLEMRSRLMMSLEDIIRKNKWTQAVAAKKCGVSQPRINDLLRGRIDKFSIDALVTMASALGHRVHMEIREAA